MLSGGQFHICDVCRLLDYDASIKFCGYCPICDAWICQPDQNNWVRRLQAAAKRKLEFGYRGDPDYVDKIKKEMEG